MELAPQNSSLTFEVTFDSPSLHVAMSVYDTTGGSPSLVSGPTAMTHVVGNTYVGKFTPTPSFTYLVFKAVYTDNTFSTLDDNYAQGSESFIASYASSGGGASSGGCSIVGYVENISEIIGLVNC